VALFLFGTVFAGSRPVAGCTEGDLRERDTSTFVADFMVSPRGLRSLLVCQAYDFIDIILNQFFGPASPDSASLFFLTWARLLDKVYQLDYTLVYIVLNCVANGNRIQSSTHAQ